MSKRGFWRTLGDSTLDAISPITESLGALGIKARDLKEDVINSSIQDQKEKAANGELASIEDVNAYVDRKIAVDEAFRRLYR